MLGNKESLTVNNVFCFFRFVIVKIVCFSGIIIIGLKKFPTSYVFLYKRLQTAPLVIAAPILQGCDSGSVFE